MEEQKEEERGDGGFGEDNYFIIIPYFSCFYNYTHRSQGMTDT